MNAKLAVIAAHAVDHAARLMSRVLSVSPGWFHAWRAAPDRPARQAPQDAMAARTRAIVAERRARYGAPCIHAELVAQGERIARKTVARLMKQNDIRPPRRVPRTTDSRHKLGIAANLLARTFKVGTPDTVWLADISHVPTDEGWLCLAAVRDLATREIVGWAMSPAQGMPRDRRRAHGAAEPQAAAGPDRPLRSRGPGRLRRPSQAAGGARRARLRERPGELSR